jgi:D-alanine-D-alanine ligase
MPERMRSQITMRETVVHADLESVRQIVSSTGFFSAAEADVAVELVYEHLQRGTASGYHFLFAEREGRPVGYACYGPIACTTGSYDLFWIAVHDDSRRHGLGKTLLEASEERIARAGGRRIYIETSGRPQYAPTQHFYERCGYKLEAVLADFYAPGDDKLIYSRAIGAAPE